MNYVNSSNLLNVACLLIKMSSIFLNICFHNFLTPALHEPPQKKQKKRKKRKEKPELSVFLNLKFMTIVPFTILLEFSTKGFQENLINFSTYLLPPQLNFRV